MAQNFELFFLLRDLDLTWLGDLHWGVSGLHPSRPTITNTVIPLTVLIKSLFAIRSRIKNGVLEGLCLMTDFSTTNGEENVLCQPPKILTFDWFLIVLI
jgi:hypothetical protein